MRHIIKDQVFIYFIANDKDSRIFYNRSQLGDIFFGQHSSGGIVWAVQHDHPCFHRYFLLHLLPVDLILGETKAAQYWYSAIDLYIGNIAVVCWLKDDHFIP